MTYTVYADLLLASNFIMDVLLLWLIRRMMRLEARKWGLAPAALLGALYALAAAVFPLPAPLEAFFTYAGVSVLMVLAAFRIRGRGELFKAVAGLYMASCLMAGVMELLAFSGLLFKPWMFAAVPGSLFFVVFLWDQTLAGVAKNGHLYQVEVTYRGQMGRFVGFLDTGNRLTEPVSGKPVCILSAESAGGLFSALDGVLYIPFRSVGKEGGVLPAVRAERMEVEKEGVRLVVEAPYIAFSKEALSRDNTYQMLLNEGIWM